MYAIPSPLLVHQKTVPTAIQWAVNVTLHVQIRIRFWREQKQWNVWRAALIPNQDGNLRLTRHVVGYRFNVCSLVTLQLSYLQETFVFYFKSCCLEITTSTGVVICCRGVQLSYPLRPHFDYFYSVLPHVNGSRNEPLDRQIPMLHELLGNQLFNYLE